MRPLGALLAKSGFRCLAPLLPGHGEKYAGMDSCLIEDWLEAVHLTFEALRRDGSPVAVIGFCLGGTLALHSASELGPRGLVVVATPLQKLMREHFTPIESDSSYKLFDTSKWVQDCVSSQAKSWRKKSCHLVTTSNFLTNFERVMEQTKPRLGQIRCPVLVASGQRDRCVPTEDTNALLTQLKGAESKDVCELPLSGHAVLVDSGRTRVHQEILSFLLRLDRVEQKLTF